MGAPPGPREARPEGKPHDPAIQPASVGERKDSFAPADAGALGGRLKGDHGEGA